MSYGIIDELCLYEIAGCPLILKDGTTLGTVEGLKRHKGGCEVLLITTEEGREIQFPIYEQIIVECSPYEHLILDPPQDLLEMYKEGRHPKNPCEIVRRDVASRRLKKAA